jgi:hypothetical protein
MMQFQLVITDISEEMAASIFIVVREECYFWTMIIVNQQGVISNKTNKTVQASTHTTYLLVARNQAKN